MFLVRFSIAGRNRWGRLQDNEITPLLSDPYDGIELDTRITLPVDAVRLLPPAVPTKIVCVGRNYAEHARELGNMVPDEPLLFLKPPSSLIPHQGVVRIPPQSTRVEHEGELAVVIGQRLFRAKSTAVRDKILGYTCFNDVTARDLQRKDVQFTRGKGFDTFAPCGPMLRTDLDPSDLAIETAVSGQVRQSGRTSQMVVPVLDLIAYISSIMTLEPGDIVVTGTPAGVGPLVAGDSVDVTIEGIGTLSNTVENWE
ncbi:MAG: fumarylacetoacetate hydrolase family protein [Myxococcales bacterium]|nr:fumarylacetoacetate hydrolase family protein [Myxococcales bacterium]